MTIQPYLFFDGRAEEAAEFYRDKLGAEVTALMRFSDHPAPPDGAEAPEGCALPPDSADKVMHMSLKIGDTEIMGSDGQCAGAPSFQGFALALTAPDADAAEKMFAALGDGGTVQMPLAETFFSPRFGMVADRFGIPWMVVVAQAEEAAA